jgi:hypothetical protein
VLQHFEKLLWTPAAHDNWPFNRRSGYAAIWVDGVNTQAHIVACERVHGPRPSPEHHAAHSCRNRHCFYVGHLTWAHRTKNNNEDKRRDGTLLLGSAHQNAKLDEEAVLVIRAALAEGRTQTDIASEFGVTPSNVSSIGRRKTWTHI